MSPAAVFLLATAAKATLLLALAGALERMVLRRRGSAAARHLLWTLALAGVLLLPVLGWMLPGWRVPVIAADAPTFQADRPASSSIATPQSARADEALAPAASMDASAAPATVSPEPVGVAAVNPPTPSRWTTIADTAASIAWTRVLLALYVAGALLMLARVAMEQLLVRRLAHGATPVRDEEWGALMRSTASGLGVRRPVTLLRSDGPTMPLTWGVVRPAVLLPAEADAWPSSRRRAVLVHELAHVARHDCLTQTLAAVACALYWPHPGVWWAAARMRAERELACDDAALAHGIGAREYGRHLLELARGLRAPSVLTSAAVSMASPSHLEMRLLAAIDEARVRTAPGRRATMLGAALTALLLLPLAAIQASAAAEPVDSLPVAPSTGERAASPASTGRVIPRPPATLDSTAAAVDSAAAIDSTAVDSAAVAGQQPFGGQWHVRMAEPSEAVSGAPTVHVMMQTPGLNTFYAPLAQFDGLTRELIASSAPDASFRLRREPGTFTFTGSFRGGRGTGHLGFAPDPAYAQALARRGMEAPTPEQQFSLARHGVPLAFLDELAAQGYAGPTTAIFVRAGLSGADLRYVREMAGLGYRLGTLEAAVRAYNVGIEPAYIRELAAVGYRGLSVAELGRMRSNDVDADFIRRMNASAGRTLSADELASLRARGATSAPPAAPSPPVTAIAAAPAPAVAGPAGFTPDGTTPTTGRWNINRTRGASAQLELLWDDDTQWRRPMALAELSGVTGDEIASRTPAAVSFRIDQDAGTFEFAGTFQEGAGTGTFRFRPNRQFSATLRQIGIPGVGGGLSDHQLKNLAWGGMSGESARQLKALGFTSLTARELIDIAIRSLTPEYARSMRSLGVAGSETVAGIIELRFHSVTPAYVRDLAALGYRGLTTSQVVEMWRTGVTTAFIRGVRDSGTANPSPETLIQLRERQREARRGG